MEMASQHLSRTGQGHVEIIISFVLFVAFLLSAFAILNATQTNFKRTTLDREQAVIIDSVSKTYGKLSVFVESASGCYDNKKNIIEAQYGRFIEAFHTNNPGGSITYTLYFADFFNPSRYGVISCAGNVNGIFILGGYTEEKVIVKKKLEVLKKEYENPTTYPPLSANLGIDNFAFSVRTIEGVEQSIFSVSPNEKISPAFKIASIDFPIVIMDDQGNKQEYIMNIRKW